MITRTENISVRLLFDGRKLSDGDRKRIEEFFENAHEMRLRFCELDTLSSDFNFDIYYFGKVDKQMSFIINMIDKSKVISCNIKELKHNRSLFIEMVRKLDAIIDLVERNK